MNLQQFLYSLLLLLLGQVPLVIKLWLEHKGRVEPYRKHLYERQAGVFLDLYVALSKAHTALHNCLSVFPPDLPVSSDHQALHSETKQSLGARLTDWSETLDRSEIFLPAQLVKLSWDYKVLQSQLLMAAVGVHNLSRDEITTKWQTLSQHYNGIINGMRLSLGIDSLSAQLLALVDERKKQLVITTRNL